MVWDRHSSSAQSLFRDDSGQALFAVIRDRHFSAIRDGTGGTGWFGTGTVQALGGKHCFGAPLHNLYGYSVTGVV